MKKALFVATVGRFLGFERNDIKILQSLGYEVHIAANLYLSEYDGFQEESVIRHQIDFARIPWSKTNLNAYKQLKRLFSEIHFDIIHCHTPMGGALGRLAARKYREMGTKVIYTAHGFHFCRNAPKKNWLMFYPVEGVLSHWTDVLITINEEDYRFARKHMRAKKVRFVPGVGIDLNKYASDSMDEITKSAKRTSLGLNDQDKVFVSVGELDRDKNHILMIEALERIKNSNYKYIICGAGGLEKEYTTYLRDNNLENNVKLLGYRNDIAEILQIADIFVFPSTFEGLSVALMEAIASKVMVVCSASRGNTDLVKDERCLFDYRSVDGLIKAIHNVENFTVEEKTKILEDNYSRLLPREKSRVTEIMRGIYQEAAEIPTQ